MQKSCTSRYKEGKAKALVYIKSQRANTLVYICYNKARLRRANTHQTLLLGNASLHQHKTISVPKDMGNDSTQPRQGT